MRENGLIQWSALYQTQCESVGIVQQVFNQTPESKDIYCTYRLFRIPNQTNMPSIKACLGKALRTVDLFPTSNFLRYSAESDYTTSTGGLISVAVIIIFVILFANMGLKTARKQIITSEYYVENDSEPNPLTVTTSPDGGFMFMVGMPGFDVTNNSYKIFNISLFQEYYSPVLRLTNITSVPLAPCKQDHFAFNSEIVGLFYKLGMSKMLCPPLGHQLQVMGKKTSDTFARFRVAVEKCNKSIDAGCITDAEFAALEASQSEFSVAVPMITLKINPYNEAYKSVYLQDRNYITFSSTFGVSAYVDVEEDVIETDVSLMPYETLETENLTMIPNLFNNVYYASGSQKPYSEVIFTKIPQTTVYSRSFNKVDNYFSYVGGLIGTIIGLIFILNAYTEMAYEISIARKLHLNNDGTDIKSPDFNFFYYMASFLFNILVFFKHAPDWAQTKLFVDCSEEMQMQLDITYILRRLNFLDSLAEILMRPHQLKTLYMRKKMTLNQARQKRKEHFAPESIANPIRNSGRRDDLSGQFSNKDITLHQIVLKTNNEPSLSIGQDISAYDISENTEDIEDYKASIQKVYQEGLAGRPISKRIADLVDCRLVGQVPKSEDSGRKFPADGELIEVKPKQGDLKLFFFDFEEDDKAGGNDI